MSVITVCVLLGALETSWETLPTAPQAPGTEWREPVVCVAGEMTAVCVLCTESNVIQVVSQEEPSKGSLNLPQEPGQENVPDPQAVDGQDAGGAGGPGQNPQVSPDQLGSQEREESEVPERDQLIIRDGQEEQDAAGKGG